MDYAIIDNNVVVNIAVASAPIDENWISRGDKPVNIGDVYDGKDFYRNGSKVLSINEELQMQLADMEMAVNILLGEVTS